MPLVVGLRLAMFGKDRYEEAIRNLDKAIKIDSNFATTHFIKGKILVEQGRYDEATKSFNRALAIDPSLLQADPSIKPFLEHLDKEQ